MGRVDEAMRRAAEAVADPDRAERKGTTPATDRLNADLFPAETADRPRLRSVTPVAAGQPDPAGSVQAPPPAGARHIRGGRLGNAVSSKTVVDQDTDPVSKEQYRRLATTLYSVQAEQQLKVVMVASAVPGEGKSLTAANLAMTLSESYQKRVLLIDGDLRRPTLHTVFDVDPSPGLTDGLTGEGKQAPALHQVSTTLTVIPAGHPTDDPMAILASDEMHRLIERARDRFDWVIVDTPPIGLLADANVLSGMTDGAVLVVRAESTDYEIVQRAVAMLGHDRVLGVVLNRANVGTARQYDYRSYYGSRGRAPARRGSGSDR